MDKHFQPVTLAQKDKYYELWHKTPRRSLDYTLTNLWGWQEYYGLEWYFENNLCWIRQTSPIQALWAPVGDWNIADWQKLPECFGDKCEIIRVPLELTDILRNSLGSGLAIREERGQWEYLYRQDELSSLAGNRFHKKRNHLNSYIKTYGEPDYREINPRMVDDMLSVQDHWCQWHECDDSPSLLAENRAIIRVLTHWNEFDHLVGGSLYVQDRMIAFSVGEKLDAESLGVHFEKGLNGYKGVYQAINYEFSRNAGQGYTWINRAQDLDEEGLRQAKMTYMPAGFLQKYTVEINTAS